MSELREFKFSSVYRLADIIDKAVTHQVELFNFDENYFLFSSTKFSRDTILHQYIVCELTNYYSGDFRHNGENFDEERMQDWYDLFYEYSIEVNEFDFESEELDIYDWYCENRECFCDLFDEMADEVFHLLFINRGFLLRFNNLITETVKEFKYPKEFLNKNGRIKRQAIPKWLQKAIYHRDKGRCVFCNTDLTGIVNSLSIINFDHIVPLDKFGINDPSNIQLCCERCNKSKKNKEGQTTNNYSFWWKRAK